MNIENSFWFRHFLMCSKVANTMMSSRGWHVDNFAKSIIAQKQNIKSVLFAAKKANVEDIVSYFENNIKTDLLVQLIIN